MARPCGERAPERAHVERATGVRDVMGLKMDGGVKRSSSDSLPGRYSITAAFGGR